MDRFSFPSSALGSRGRARWVLRLAPTTVPGPLRRPSRPVSVSSTVRPVLPSPVLPSPALPCSTLPCPPDVVSYSTVPCPDLPCPPAFCPVSVDFAQSLRYALLETPFTTPVVGRPPFHPDGVSSSPRSDSCVRGEPPFRSHVSFVPWVPLLGASSRWVTLSYRTRASGTRRHSRRVSVKTFGSRGSQPRVRPVLRRPVVVRPVLRRPVVVRPVLRRPVVHPVVVTDPWCRCACPDRCGVL